MASVAAESEGFARELIEDLAAREIRSSTKVEMYVEITFDPAKGAAKGESIDGQAAEVARLLPGFETSLLACGIGAVRRATPAQMGRRLRVAFDPEAATSAEVAEAAGVPRDRWVFPLAGTDGHDTYEVLRRRDLHSSPAITECGRQLFAMAGRGPDDVAHIDLYSCFPSAVQVGAESFGFGLDRPLTLTGGLTFAGGPLNNYVSHKHAAALYSTEPSSAGSDESGWRWADVQAVIDQVPETSPDYDYAGTVTVEAYTVLHNGDGSQVGLCAAETPGGGRTWGQVTDANALASMMVDEAIGQTGSLAADGVLTLA